MSNTAFYFLTEPSLEYASSQPKSPFKSLGSNQRRELDFDTSSEEHPGTGSPSPTPHSAGVAPYPSSPIHPRASLGSQASRPSGAAKISQSPPNGVQQCLERAKAADTSAATAASVAQHHGPEPSTTLSPTPPALPPKTRKAKVPEVPKVFEHSDRGDSDMDEETYSSSQEKLKVKKV